MPAAAAIATNSASLDRDRLLHFTARRLSKIRASSASESSSSHSLPLLRQIDHALMSLQSSSTLASADIDRVARLQKETKELLLIERKKSRNVVATSSSGSTLTGGRHEDQDSHGKGNTEDVPEWGDVFKANSAQGTEHKLQSRHDDLMNMTDTTSAASIESLLVQQRTLHQQEIDEEKRLQAALMSEVCDLTAALKDASIRINQAVVEQNFQLDSIQQHASANVEELEDQKKKVDTHCNSLFRF